MGPRSLCVTLGLAVTLPAAADPDPQAEKLFRDGRRLIKEGRIAEACDAFSGSSHLEPSVGTLLNLGDCRARLGQTASAWAAFVEAGRLARNLNDDRQAEANRRATELEPALSYLVVTVTTPTPGLVVARNGTPIDPAVWGQSVPLDPGDYRIIATAAGYDPFSTTVAIHADADHEAVAVPALHLRPRPLATPAQPIEIFTRTRKIGVATAGAGIVALGAALVLGVQAKALEDQALATCPKGEPCHDLDASQKSDRAVTRANLATAIGGVGLAAAGAGVVLWFVGRPHARLVPLASPEVVGLALRGGF